MAKTVRVRSHVRKTRSGKVIKVKEHTRKKRKGGIIKKYKNHKIEIIWESDEWTKEQIKVFEELFGPTGHYHAGEYYIFWVYVDGEFVGRFEEVDYDKGLKKAEMIARKKIDELRKYEIEYVTDIAGGDEVRLGDDVKIIKYERLGPDSAYDKIVFEKNGKKYVAIIKWERDIDSVSHYGMVFEYEKVKDTPDSVLVTVLRKHLHELMKKLYS